MLAESVQIILILISFLSLLGISVIAYKYATLQARYSILYKENGAVIKKLVILEYKAGLSKEVTKTKTK